MGLPARKLDRRYTYGDYRTWPEDERWELIDGVAWNMSAAPSTFHQRVLSRLHLQFATFLEDRPCEVLPAPLDVFFPRTADQEMDAVDTVVQPDLVVVCDPGQIVERGCWGAPDLAVEILSPWTSKKDLAEKFALYERSGVREYLVLEPHGRWLQVWRLGADGKYGEPELFEVGSEAPPAARAARVRLQVPEGFELDLGRVFR